MQGTQRLAADAELMRLAESCEVHAVVAASTLTALALTQPPVLERDWKIPVTVRPRCVHVSLQNMLMCIPR